MHARAVLQARELLEDDFWVVDACWPDRPAEQLIGVFTSLESAETWIKDGSHAWRKAVSKTVAA
jgi:hypothetical protein